MHERLYTLALLQAAKAEQKRRDKCVPPFLRVWHCLSGDTPDRPLQRPLTVLTVGFWHTHSLEG